jgi:putative SOS response-associated peptidase YedK
MCGRYTLIGTDGLADRFGLEFSESVVPRFNIAPSQGVLTIVDSPTGPALRAMRWGFQPIWARMTADRPPPINARAETIATNGLFRSSFEWRRCLIPADGFYEWQAVAGSRRKQPVRFRRPDGGLFAFAGLYTGDRDGPDESATCLIVTTVPNRLVEPIHNRMPVVLAPQNEARWLARNLHETESLRDLLAPCPDDWFIVEPASDLVSSPFNEGPELLAPLPPPIQPS